MPPKAAVSGFAVFMREINERRRLNMSGAQLAGFCGPLWAHLSKEEKKAYDQRAKEMRAGGDMVRRDNLGNIISDRRNPEKTRRDQRDLEKVEFTQEWPHKDVTEEKFYFINFQDLCELSESNNTSEREWLPREVGIVEFSLRHGIMGHYQKFIHPGPIPSGYRFTCMQKSEDTHKIPIEDFEHDCNDYILIWNNIKQFLRGGKASGLCAPVYCLDVDHLKTNHLLEWLCYQAREDIDRMPTRVYTLEDLVTCLLAHSGHPDAEEISPTAVVSKLDGSHWDYMSKTSCEWHEEQETKYCALGIVRRYTYTISDILAQVYNIQLTPNHVPISSPETFGIVLPPQTKPDRGSRTKSGSRGRNRERPSNRGDADPLKSVTRHLAYYMFEQESDEEDLCGSNQKKSSPPQSKAPDRTFQYPESRPWGQQQASQSLSTLHYGASCTPTGSSKEDAPSPLPGLGRGTTIDTARRMQDRDAQASAASVRVTRSPSEGEGSVSQSQLPSYQRPVGVGRGMPTSLRTQRPLQTSPLNESPPMVGSQFSDNRRSAGAGHGMVVGGVDGVFALHSQPRQTLSLSSPVSDKLQFSDYQSSSGAGPASAWGASFRTESANDPSLVHACGGQTCADFEPPAFHMRGVVQSLPTYQDSSMGPTAAGGGRITVGRGLQPGYGDPQAQVGQRPSFGRGARGARRGGLPAEASILFGRGTPSSQ